MKKNIFLCDGGTFSFSTWLSEIVCDSRPLNFRYGNCTYKYFSEAKNAYAWPPKRVNFETPNGYETLEKGSALAVNGLILEKLSAGLKASLEKKEEKEVATWVEGVLRWGGVFTRSNGKGNVGWLDSYKDHGGLCAYLSGAVAIIDAATDDDDVAKIKNLRSNAGLTKIYSLLCNDFIIYDSRVAAALSWLVSKWSNETGFSIPDHLRFAAMRANTSKKEGKKRSADPKVFGYFSPSGNARNHLKHLRWNLRANWLLQSSIRLSCQQPKKKGIVTLRELEATLFVIGDDLKDALAFSSDN